MSATDVGEVHTTVPYRYRARLVRSEHLGIGYFAEHAMQVKGSVHPQPYEHDAAVALTQRKLAPLVELGWRIKSLIVNGYGEEDA